MCHKLQNTWQTVEGNNCVKFSDSYGSFQNSSVHLAVNEVIAFFKRQDFSNSVYLRNMQNLVLFGETACLEVKYSECLHK
jgi:hypothetical protein